MAIIEIAAIETLSENGLNGRVKISGLLNNAAPPSNTSRTMLIMYVVFLGTNKTIKPKAISVRPIKIKNVFLQFDNENRETKSNGKTEMKVEMKM